MLGLHNQEIILVIITSMRPVKKWVRHAKLGIKQPTTTARETAGICISARTRGLRKLGYGTNAQGSTHNRARTTQPRLGTQPGKETNLHPTRRSGPGPPRCRSFTIANCRLLGMRISSRQLLSCALIRGRGIVFRHCYQSIAKCAGKDFRDGAAVPFE